LASSLDECQPELYFERSMVSINVVLGA